MKKRIFVICSVLILSVFILHGKVLAQRKGILENLDELQKAIEGEPPAKQVKEKESLQKRPEPRVFSPTEKARDDINKLKGELEELKKKKVGLEGTIENNEILKKKIKTDLEEAKKTLEEKEKELKELIIKYNEAVGKVNLTDEELVKEEIKRLEEKWKKEAKDPKKDLKELGEKHSVAVGKLQDELRRKNLVDKGLIKKKPGEKFDAINDLRKKATEKAVMAGEQLGAAKVAFTNQNKIANDIKSDIAAVEKNIKEDTKKLESLTSDYSYSGIPYKKGELKVHEDNLPKIIKDEKDQSEVQKKDDAKHKKIIEQERAKTVRCYNDLVASMGQPKTETDSTESSAGEEGIEAAISTAAEDVTKTPVPTKVLEVGLETYKLMSKLHDPETVGGKLIILKKLGEKGYTGDEASNMVEKLEELHKKIKNKLQAQDQK